MSIKLDYAPRPPSRFRRLLRWLFNVRPLMLDGGTEPPASLAEIQEIERLLAQHRKVDPHAELRTRRQ